MKKPRFGIVGLGNMGMHHLGTLMSMDDVEVTAICDIDAAKLNACSQKHSIQGFEHSDAMLDSGLVDAVVIATPHYDHPTITRAAFARGIHVLTEKPVAVDVKEARSVAQAHASQYSHLKFGAMFQMRTNPLYGRVRDLITSGELGEISRFTWIVTDWFRTWTYYASGGWRATWKGEGGGVLLNQCPHNLDLMQWMLGGLMPSRVTAVAFLGKTHPIEVEDEVSAILEYPSGAIGHFIATTGEAPGTNRLEIAGDRGKLVLENGKLQFRRTRHSVKETLQNSPQVFASVETWDIDIPVPSHPEGTKVMLQNFVKAIVKDEPLIAPATEGARGLEIGNAMLLSGVTRKPVDLPLDGDAYQAFLKGLVAESAGKEKKLTTRDAAVDMNASFGR